jgi:hypothetical protein
MPCFMVQKDYVMIDSLHLLVRGNPGPILRARLVQKATIGACLVEELHFWDFFAFSMAKSHLH